MPEDIGTLYKSLLQRKKLAKGNCCRPHHILAIIVAMVVFVILFRMQREEFLYSIQRKCREEKWLVVSQHIPLKGKYSRRYPCYLFIFSLRRHHRIIASFLGKGNGNGIGSKIFKGTQTTGVIHPRTNLFYRTDGLHFFNYSICIFLYTITFNPIGDCKQYEKSGGFIPGIRPGKPTSDYFKSDSELYCIYRSIGLTIVAFDSDIL